MPLINCKIHLDINWIDDCILSSAGDSAKLQISDAKLHVPIITLSTKYNVNLTKQLSDGFKKFVYWKNYQTIPAKVVNQGTSTYELLSASFQGVKRLFVLVYTIAANASKNEVGIKDNKKYFLPRGKIESYNVLIDGRNFYDQPINDLIKQYNDNYKYNYGLVAVDLSKKKL